MVLEERERAGERASIPTPRANRKRFSVLAQNFFSRDEREQNILPRGTILMSSSLPSFSMHNS